MLGRRDIVDSIFFNLKIYCRIISTINLRRKDSMFDSDCKTSFNKKAALRSDDYFYYCIPLFLADQTIPFAKFHSLQLTC